MHWVADRPNCVSTRGLTLLRLNVPRGPSVMSRLWTLPARHLGLPILWLPFAAGDGMGWVVGFVVTILIAKISLSCWMWNVCKPFPHSPLKLSFLIFILAPDWTAQSILPPVSGVSCNIGLLRCRSIPRMWSDFRICPLPPPTSRGHWPLLMDIVPLPWRPLRGALGCQLRHLGAGIPWAWTCNFFGHEGVTP